MIENAILTKKQRANDLKTLMKKRMILSQSYNPQTAMKISNKFNIVSSAKKKYARSNQTRLGVQNKAFV